jgi:SAM-dependent methyltransferase
VSQPSHFSPEILGRRRPFVQRVWFKLVRSIPPRLRNPVIWGSFRRTAPFTRTFGAERGLPVCRYYIEEFLQQNANDIRGRTLEVGDDTYTRRFGGSRVSRAEVLHIAEGSPDATIIADLTQGTNLESASFDCIILTQTLSSIYDLSAAVNTIYRILKPGGVVLVSVPGIAQISRYDMNRWGDYWRFTTASAYRLFQPFKDGKLDVYSFGNVAAAVAYLEGLATEDIGKKALQHNDPDYQLVVTIRAVKPLRSAR